MPGSPVPAPFTRKKFISHCQELVDNPGKLSNEFRLLQTLSVDLQMPTNTACLQANRKKNRYSDILPCTNLSRNSLVHIRDLRLVTYIWFMLSDDFSRVKLEVIDNDPNTDYINASFIKVNILCIWDICILIRQFISIRLKLFCLSKSIINISEKHE